MPLLFILCSWLLSGQPSHGNRWHKFSRRGSSGFFQTWRQNEPPSLRPASLSCREHLLASRRAYTQHLLTERGCRCGTCVRAPKGAPCSCPPRRQLSLIQGRVAPLPDEASPVWLGVCVSGCMTEMSYWEELNEDENTPSRTLNGEGGVWYRKVVLKRVVILQ